MISRISIGPEAIDLQRAHDWLAGEGDSGAVVVFTGHVRSEAGALEGLFLEHFPGLAEREIARIVGEADARWGLLRVCVEHRVGQIPAGGLIVLVGVASAHRHAAFDAAEMIMDFLKVRAPLWKKTINADGGGDWVSQRQSDAAAGDRWLGEED